VSKVLVTMLGLGVFLLFIPTASAEEQRGLELGSHVRVTVDKSSIGSPHTRKWEGELIGLSDTTLTVERSFDQRLVIRREDIAGLEMRLQRSQRGQGALIGLAAGALFGAVLGFTSGDEKDCIILCFTAEQKAAIGAAVFAPVGLLIGIAVAPGTRWQSIPTDKIRLGFGQNRRGEYRLGLSVRF